MALLDGFRFGKLKTRHSVINNHASIKFVNSSIDTANALLQVSGIVVEAAIQEPINNTDLSCFDFRFYCDAMQSDDEKQLIVLESSESIDIFYTDTLAKADRPCPQGDPGTLGFAYLPPDGECLEDANLNRCRSEIFSTVIATNLVLSVNSGLKLIAERTVAHELGHLMGLFHVDQLCSGAYGNIDNLMLSPGTVSSSRLTPLQVATILTSKIVLKQ